MSQFTVTSRERCLTLFYMQSTLWSYWKRHNVACLFKKHSRSMNFSSLRVKCGVVVYCSAGPFRRGIPQLSLDFLYVTHFRSVFLKITSSRESTTDCSDIFIQKEQFFLMHMNKWHAGECKKTIKIKSSGQGRITNWDTRPQTALKCTILAHSVVVGWFSTNQEG